PALVPLGVAMFELLTGRPPFTGDAAMAVAYQPRAGRVPSPSSQVPGLPKALDRVVLHATEKDRTLRPASARSMAEEISAEAGSLPPAPRVAELAGQIPSAEFVPDERAATVTIPRTLSPRARRKRRAWLMALVLSVLVLLGAGGWAA